MIEDDARVDPKAHSAPDTYGETLLYDYAKWMTTLSLLALGGVLTITQTADLKDIKLFNIGFVLIALALAGMLSFSTANALVSARAAGKAPPPSLPGLMKAATAFLGIGTGGFLMMWWDSLR